ncbi:MAG: metal-sensitive transcriptional regulator [Actinomycetaceae bacterium]|nr:metal-sensitive transcriptional regulator [Actinomycetaceae bacterium]
MELSPKDKTAILNRLKRASGQLRGVTRMIDEDEDCAAIVTQLAACTRALDKAGFAIMSSGMQSCLAGDRPEEERKESLRQLEKLFLALA